MKTFCDLILDRANSIQTALRTCNLWTGWSVTYNSVILIWIEFAPSNGIFLHLQMAKKHMYKFFAISTFFAIIEEMKILMTSFEVVEQLHKRIS